MLPLLGAPCPPFQLIIAEWEHMSGTASSSRLSRQLDHPYLLGNLPVFKALKAKLPPGFSQVVYNPRCKVQNTPQSCALRAAAGLCSASWELERVSSDDVLCDPQGLA